MVPDNSYSFAGRQILFATKHEKEQIVRDLFEKELQVEVIATVNFDTDLLGTFSGEKLRIGTALETVRQKAKEAAKLFNHDLVLASEGSFGPHPEIFFAHANEEYLLLADLKHNREFIVKHLTTDTNFAGDSFRNTTDLKVFLKKVGFPEAKVILKDREDNPTLIIKDIESEEVIIAKANEILSNSASFYVETDMRAMNNPLRRKAIAETASKLIQKVKSLCPNCKAPGFDFVKVMTGLPCELCNRPTSSVKTLIYSCEVCSFETEMPRPDSKKYESAMYCNYCNP
jgi:hypothetical protein